SLPEVGEVAGAVAAQAGRWDRVEKVGELAEADAAHFRQSARGEQEARQRVVVRPRFPRLEVLAERERGAVAEVADPEGVPQAAVGLALDACRRERELVREEVVVHRDDPEGVADERDLEQRKAPEPELPL